MDGPRCARLQDLERRESPLEHTKVVDEPILQAVVPHPFADADVISAAAGDLAGEAVSHDLGGHGVAVHEDPQPRRPARSVARHGHVHPVPHGQRLCSPHARRVSRPEVDQRPAEVAVGHQQFVAPAAGISPGLRAVKDHRPFIRYRSEHPERHRERMTAMEVAHPRLHRMVAGELDRLAEPALHEHVLARRRSGLLRAELIRESALIGTGVESQADDLPRNHPDLITGEEIRLRMRAAHPLRDRLPHRHLTIGQFRRPRTAGLVGLRQRGRRRAIEDSRLRRRHSLREEGIEPRLVDVVEEREQGVEVVLREWVELVVVAAAALERQAKKCGAEGGHAVVDVVDAILLLDRPPLGLLRVEPVERCGEHLLIGGVGEQVARHLPERELVPGQVAVEGMDHPVAPGPHRRPRSVELEAVAVGVAGQIHPVGGHSLPVAGACEQAIDELFVGIGRGIGHEGLDLGRRGRQPSKVEGHPPDERGSVGLGLGAETPRGEFLHDHRVDRVPCIAGGEGWPDGRHERPVRLVRRPLRDPPLQGCDLLVGQPADLRLGRRHDGVWVVRHDAGQQFADGRVLRNDRSPTAVELGRGLIEIVEPKASLPGGAVGTVARKAVFREDRPDVAVERDSLRSRVTGISGTHDQARAESQRRSCRLQESHAGVPWITRFSSESYHPGECRPKHAAMIENRVHGIAGNAQVDGETRPQLEAGGRIQ